MGMYAARFRFAGTPPTAEQIETRLRLELGEDDVLEGYSVEGAQVLILTSPDAITPAYARKVLRDLGGVQIDREGHEFDEPLPAFVNKPWREHNEATRKAIKLAFERTLPTQK